MPLYEIEKQNGFKAGDQRGIEFATRGSTRSWTRAGCIPSLVLQHLVDQGPALGQQQL